jgi:hypothetical protein
LNRTSHNSGRPSWTTDTFDKGYSVGVDEDETDFGEHFDGGILGPKVPAYDSPCRRRPGFECL